MAKKSYDILIIGSGAGGGTVAAALSPLVAKGCKILLLEKGPRFTQKDFTGKELEMSQALYEEGAGFLNSERSIMLAFAKAYGGTTVVYTGTSITAPKHVIESWQVPDLHYEDILKRSNKYLEENNVHLLEEDLINDNNKLFREGCKKAGYKAEQFPLNLKGCLGSSLCNLGCPNMAKQGTHRVQLPFA